MKKIKRENKPDKFFLLSWKKIFIGLIIFIAAVILHNLVYGFFIDILKIEIGDEIFFFIIATLIIPVYFIISVIYSITKYFKKRIKRR